MDSAARATSDRKTRVDNIFNSSRSLDNEGKAAASSDVGVDWKDGGAGISAASPLKAKKEVSSTKLDWFSGVMVPVLLNIWGVIMFLRLGWVVGQAGILQGSAIIILSNVVTTITSLSLCAIATNGAVKGGGAYYLISRALGPAFGGAIGLLFFIAQAVATSMYVIGFAESLLNLLYQSALDAPFMGDEMWDMRIVGIATCVMLLGVALIGVGWYAKCQIVLLVILIISIASVIIGTFLPKVGGESTNRAAGFVGYADRDLSDALKAKYYTDVDTLTETNFFAVFAIFFPAVTGIMAGANMSGDLAKPSEAIPKGTLWGIVITFISYLGLLWMIGASCQICADETGVFCVPGSSTSNEGIVGSKDWTRTVQREKEEDGLELGGLVYNSLIMANVSVWSPLVYTGVFAATLSSALASLVGAPRILQALAKDRIFDFWWFYYFAQLPMDDYFGSGNNNASSGAEVASGPSDRSKAGADASVSKKAGASANDGEDEEETESPEPVRGYFLTFVIALGCVMIGELNAIAPIISNFFMISYALTNYACFAASWSDSPGWRPSFNYWNKYVSLVGAGLCIGIMFGFDPIMGGVSIVLCVLLYSYIETSSVTKEWGTAGESRAYVSAINAMAVLKAQKGHIKTFRPAYLVFADELAKDDRTEPASSVAVAGAAAARRPAGGHTPSKMALALVTKLYRGRGATVVGQVVLPPANSGRSGVDEQLLARAVTVRQNNHEYLERKLVLAPRQRNVLHAEVVAAKSFRDGARNMLQLAGMSGLRPNVSVLGYQRQWWSKPAGKVAEFEGVIRDSVAANMGVMVVRDETERFFDNWLKPRMIGQVQPQGMEVAGKKEVHVYWLFDEGGLALLVPFLLRANPQFRSEHKLNIFTVGELDASDRGNDLTVAANNRQLKLQQYLNDLRFDAKPNSLKLRLSETYQESIDAFNAMYPGVISDAQGKPGTAPVPKAGAPSAGAPPRGSDSPLVQASQAARGGDGGRRDLASSMPTRSPFDGPNRGLSAGGMNPQARQFTQRVVRTGELIRQNSQAATVIFIVLPFIPGLPDGLLSAWMETLSHSLPPCVFIRGNGQRVVTDLS